VLIDEGVSLEMDKLLKLLLNLGVDVEPLIGLVVIRGVGRRFC
jgi:hypothetical protein